MSTIPTNLTEKQFDEHVRPYISIAKRGYECQISLYKGFNYILFRLHTGCQWHRLLIEDDPEHPRKKKSVGMRFTTIFASGAGMAVQSECGKAAS